MWALDNQTPFVAERSWVRDKNGAEVWVVAIKASFDFTATGQVVLAEQQQAVTMAAEYTDETNTVLRYDTDLPEYKIATDVLVNGAAYAPDGHPAKQWVVNLRVGPINKSLLISGDRTWQKGLLRPVLSEPKPMVSLPLSYQYAFGGCDPSGSSKNAQHIYALNPAGRGYAQEKSTFINLPAPNIEYLSSPIRHWKDQPSPAGFSAIPGHRQPRAGFAGTYDQAWEHQRHPLLPEDFDPRFFQCAPSDQQVPGFLKGGEQVELTHLTPIRKISLYLPKASFHLVTRFSDGYKQVHRAHLHTVIIEPDEHRVMMVWHSHLACHHRVNLLESTRILLKKRILLHPDNELNQVWTG